MKRSKSLISILLVVLLMTLLALSLFACVDGTGSGTGGGPGVDPDDGTGGGGGTIIDPGDPDDNTPVTPVRPPKPPKDPNTGGGSSGSGGSGIETMGAFQAIATLMGGTQIDVTDSKYRIVNLYIDVTTGDQDTGEIKKKRFIFRTNIDQQGMANDFAVQLVDLTNLVEQPDLGGGSIVSDDQGEVTISMSAAKLAEDIAYESQGTLEWGFYAVDNKMFMDRGANHPLLYFEDFDMDYMKQLLFKVKELISDGSYDGSLQGPIFQLLNNLLDGVLSGTTVDSLLGLLSSFIFDTALITTTVDEVTGAVTKDYTCVIKINEFIGNIGAVVGMITMLAGSGLPFDLNLEPFITFLQDWLPYMEVQIQGQTVDGKTTQFDIAAKRLDITDSTDPLYQQEIFRMAINTDRCYSDNKHEIGIPQRVYDNVDFEPFSLTNIALSLDINLNSGDAVDLGAIINSFVNNELLPEGVLILDVATGLRLDLALDLDLNYGKDTCIDEAGNEVLVDRNLIMLELYLVDPVTHALVDPEPLLGVYYKSGSAYVNVSHLLDRYYAGNNIKINLGGVPTMIQYLINLVTNALDGVFRDTLGMADWVNWADLRASRLEQIGSEVVAPTPNPAPEGGELATSEVVEQTQAQVDCLALAYDEFGNYQVSMNLVTFLKSIGSIVGFGDIFGTNEDKTAIVITANAVFWDALNALANIQGFTWPGGLIAEIALNFTDKPETGKPTMTDITISAAVDSRVGYIDSENYWHIGSKATFKSLVYTTAGSAEIYMDKAMTKILQLPEGDVIDNYSIVYINEGKYYLDSAHTQEVIIGKDAAGVEYAYKADIYDVKTTVKSTDITAPSKKTVKAFLYQGEWVIGYGHDETAHIKTGVLKEGLGVSIILHDIMLCYGSARLKRFDPTYGGTSYDGYFGASNNLEGYILYRTHKRVIAENLSSKSTGTYYVYNNITKEYTKVELGTGEGQVAYNPLTTYYEIVETGYVDSVSKFLTSILGGTFLSLNLTVDFSKGAYNLAPLIGLFGLDAIKDKQLLWEFTDDFKMDVSLNIGIALDKNNPDNSKLVVEIVTRDQDISIGGTILFPKNTTILGVYGVGKKVYVEISHLRLLNIKLPDLYLELDYTTLIYQLLGEKEILDLTFDLAELLGLNASTASEQQALTSALASADLGGNLAQAPTYDPNSALSIFVDSNVVSISVTIAAIQSLLGAFGVDLGMNLTDVMNLAVDLVLNRTEGITLDITGALLPKYDPLRGNYFDEDLHIGLQMGTVVAPVQIGDTTELMKKYDAKFQTLAASTDQFHENIINALIQVIGDLSLELTIDAQTLESVWDINRIVDTIVADQADKFALPLQVNFDDWETQVKIKLQLYLDLENFKQTQILIELIYEGNVWIGIYVYQNSIVVDLNGLGLFDFEIANSTIVAKAGTVLSGMLGSLGDLSLTTLLNGLIDDLLNPQAQSDVASAEGEVAAAEGEVAAVEGETAGAEGETSGAEGELSEAGKETSASNDLIAMILAAVSANNTTVSLNLTRDVFSQLFRELLGFDLFLDLELGADINILEGTIGLGLNVEDMVYGDIGIALGVGERGAYKFDMNLDDIPDWNAINGTYMVRSLLKNLEIGLYVDLNQYTSSSGKPLYTRIYIEKLAAKKKLDKAGGAVAAKDSILVTLAGIDEAEFNNAGSGVKDTLLYAELNWMDGKIYLNICEGFLKLNILGMIPIDVGDVMGRLAIDLDLVNMLSPTIDGLLQKIEGLLDSLAGSDSSEDLGEITPQEPTPGEDEALANQNTTNGTINFIEIISTGELDRITIPENIGKYYIHNGSYYRIDASGDTAKRTKLTLNETYAGDGITFRDLPQPSAEYDGVIFKTDKEVVVVDEATNATETYYKYYICLSVTRRTFAYYNAEVISGLSGFFGGLDILSLFGKVTANLTSTGILNADVTLDTYTINMVIDKLMYYIFGPETILNLKEMTAGSSMEFSKNYLAEVYWDRLNKDGFFNSLWTVIQPILGDVLKGLINVDISFLMGAITNLKPTVKGVIDRLLPFAVGNENHLGLNIVRGQLTNIYLTMHDNNEAIYDPNGNVYAYHNGYGMMEYGGGNRSDDYFTELHIFNTSPSVGDAQYTGQTGAVTWAGVPSSITYDPYMYEDPTTAYDELYAKYFYDKEATYQEGQKLYKSMLDFTIVNFLAQGSTTIQNKGVPLSKANLNLNTPGVYTIQATAPFNNGNNTKTLQIKFTVRSRAEVQEIETLSMSVYQDFPAYLLVTTTDGVVRRFNTEYLEFYTKNEQGVVDKDSNGKPTILHRGYVNEQSADGSWDQTVYVGFPGGGDLEHPMTVHYTNSTIAEVIIAGAENNIIDIDLYSFDTKSEEGTTTSLANYTPSTLYFYYANGIADSLEVDDWIYVDEEGRNAQELFDRLNPDSDQYKSTAGAEYKIKAVVMKGTDVEQTVEITLRARSRKVSSVSFGEKTNALDIQPYEYYLYNLDKNKNYKYNPYSDQVTVNYDNYSDQVHVIWDGIGNDISYNWNNNNDYFATATVSLNPDEYPSGDLFGWSKQVKVGVSRNEIEAIYFDKALTKTNLTIDPYAYNNMTDKHAYYPQTGYVKFTNGKVLELPIAWKWAQEVDAFAVNYAEDYTQFTISIGHDVAHYTQSGEIIPFALESGATPFLQEYKVNVHVDGTAIQGILVDGSDYLGGIYYVDPVAVNYQGAAVFPNVISVRYANGRLGSVTVREWQYDETQIVMSGSSVLTAKCFITSDLSFDVKYQVLDRSAEKMTVDTSVITASPINPYGYTVLEDGRLVYDVFEDYLTVSYTTSYTLKLIGTADGKEYYSNTLTTLNEVSAERKMLRVTYNYVGATNTYTYEGNECKLSIIYNSTSYELPVYWDTNRLNLTSEGSSETVYFYFGYGTPHQIEQSVEVDFSTKVVDHAGEEDYVFILTKDAANLSPEEQRSGKVVRRLEVFFTDNTSEYVECQIDLTTLRGADNTRYGFAAGSRNLTVFDYQVAEVNASTAGTFYVDGAYTEINLRGNGIGYDPAETYYTFTEATNLNAASAGTYYIYRNGNYLEVELTGENYQSQTTYYTRQDVTASVNETYAGIVYTYDATEKVEIELTGIGAAYNANTTYYTLTISNEMYATVSVAYSSGTLVQTTEVKVYVVDIN